MAATDVRRSAALCLAAGVATLALVVPPAAADPGQGQGQGQKQKQKQKQGQGQGSGKPDKPSKDKPSKPEKPGKPESPGKPENPGKPESPGKPENPGKPEQPNPQPDPQPEQEPPAAQGPDDSADDDREVRSRDGAADAPRSSGQAGDEPEADQPASAPLTAGGGAGGSTGGDPVVDSGAPDRPGGAVEPFRERSVASAPIAVQAPQLVDAGLRSDAWTHALLPVGLMVLITGAAGVALALRRRAVVGGPDSPDEESAPLSIFGTN